MYRLSQSVEPRFKNSTTVVVNGSVEAIKHLVKSCAAYQNDETALKHTDLRRVSAKQRQSYDTIES